MPVELPQRSPRTRPVLLSLGLLAVSAGVTFAALPERAPAPTAKVVGVAAVQAGAPTSAAARVPDPLVLPRKKKPKAKPKASAVSPAAGQVASPASSATVARPSTSVAAPVQRPVTTTKKSSGASSSSSAAEAEFGPG